MSFISKTPKPPYYAVIFTSIHSEHTIGYSEMAIEMEKLVHTCDGFLGMESVRSEKNGITISYWRTQDAILQWKKNMDHIQAQKLGKSKWYESYKVRIAKVERDYGHSI